MKTYIRLNQKRMVNFILIFSVGILCSSTTYANVVRTVQEGAESAGMAIGDIINRAADISPNKPVHDIIVEMSFDPKDIPKPVVERIRDTKAMDNPMNYFYDGEEVFIHEKIYDYQDVFFKFKWGTSTSAAPETVHFLRKFVRERIDLENEEHVKAFWQSIEHHFQSIADSSGSSIDMDLARGTMINIADNVMEEQKLINLAAVGIRHGHIAKGDPLYFIIENFYPDKHRDAKIFSSPYFRKVDNITKDDLEYEILTRVTDNISHHINDSSFDMQKLWNYVTKLEKMGDETLLSSLKRKLTSMIKESVGDNPSQEELGEAFATKPKLKAIAEFGNNDRNFSNLLTEIISDIL